MKTRRFLWAVAAIAALWLGSSRTAALAAQDFEDVAQLRCQKATIEDEARLLGCSATCDERADRAVKRGDGYDAATCRNGCSQRYQQASRRHACAEPSEPIFAQNVAPADARALECHAERTAYEVGLAICRAGCEKRAATSGSAGADAASTCERSCDATLDRQKARLAPNGECPFVAADSAQLEYALAPASTETAPGWVQTPSGVIETELEVRDGYGLFEGDIVGDLGQAPEGNAQDDDLESAQGAGKKSWADYWGNLVIPFEIDPKLPNQIRVVAAMLHWMANTKFHFKVRTTESSFIRFVPANECSSPIGRVGGKQLIKLGPGCLFGQAVHEIGHALGLHHEQSRSDRDKNLSVIWWRIQSGQEHNFKTYVEQGDVNSGDFGSFNWSSIMLYDSFAFSISPYLPTMLKKSNGKTFTAQRQGLSAGDIATIKAMYQM